MKFTLVELQMKFIYVQQDSANWRPTPAVEFITERVSLEYPKLLGTRKNPNVKTVMQLKCWEMYIQIICPSSVILKLGKVVENIWSGHVKDLFNYVPLILGNISISEMLANTEHKSRYLSHFTFLRIHFFQIS